MLIARLLFVLALLACNCTYNAPGPRGLALHVIIFLRSELEAGVRIEMQSRGHPHVHPYMAPLLRVLCIAIQRSFT